MITVELRSLQLHGHHGAEAEERERGQLFLFDVAVDVGDDALTDRLENTVDYRDVARVVREVSDGRTFVLIEALAGAVADALLERLPVRRARVRVRKPQVRLEAPVEWSAATVERSRS